MSPAPSAFEGVTLHNSSDTQLPAGHKFWSNVAKLRGALIHLLSSWSFSHGSALNSFSGDKKKSLERTLLSFILKIEI